MRVAKIERKTEFLVGGGEIKVIDDRKGIIGGYLNYINNIDFGKDRTMRGAFQQTLKDSYSRKAAQALDFLWPYLFNHNYDTLLPPGGIYEADEDRKGLYTKTQFNLDVQLGRELYASFKMGTMKKQSMGYKAIQVDWVKEGGESIRNLLEVQVMEGSAVVFPMNDLAQVDTVKNRSYFFMPNKLPTKQEYPATTLDIHSKDYAESYMQVNQQDWVSDLWNLWYPLRNEILTAFQTGDTIEGDVQNALAQFAPAVLAYTQKGIELNMTECLQPSSDGDSSMPMMMSRDDNPETKEESKAGRAISEANHAKLKAAADGIKAHVATIHGVLRSASPAGGQNRLSGYQVYSGNEPPEQKEEEPQEGEDEADMLNKLRATVDDLATTLQFSNAAKGV
jgi:HK97 family phage prohead protease